VRYAFMELGVDDGIIVARTDSLGAGLTKQIAFTKRAGRHRRPVQQLPRLRGGRPANIGNGDV
jgi:isocitrate lyase